MTAQQVKSEIKKLLDSVPEAVLHDLLQYLKAAQKHGTEETQTVLHLRKIIQEDRELLEKLAK